MQIHAYDFDGYRIPLDILEKKKKETRKSLCEISSCEILKREII